MARPQRGTNRFREEPVPATSGDWGTPLPSTSSSRTLARRSTRVDSRRSQREFARPLPPSPGMISPDRPGLLPRGSEQSRRGRFMGPEIRTPVASRVAPHRRYVPADRPAPSTSPRDENRRGLYEGEPETCRRELLPFLPILAHLGLLLAVFKVYRVEGRAFQTLVALTRRRPAGPLPAPLPLEEAALRGGLDRRAWSGSSARGRRRSSLGLAAVLIGDLLPADRLVGPRRDRRRARRGPGPAPRPSPGTRPSPTTVWPVLATMFMFRMILYLYELKHAKRPEPLVDTLGYFFLLPNYCFLPLPGGRLPDAPARLLRRRHPRDPAARACG